MSGTSDSLTPRSSERESVFLLANVSARDGTVSGVFRIRNISREGVMAEGAVSFRLGCEVNVDLRNIGIVEGEIAWTDSDRFGVHFDRAIDPHATRRVIGTGKQGSR